MRRREPPETSETMDRRSYCKQCTLLTLHYTGYAYRRSILGPIFTPRPGMLTQYESLIELTNVANLNLSSSTIEQVYNV